MAHYPDRVNGVQILLIAAGGIAVAAVARRRGLEPGLIIVVLAAAASFIPAMPRLELDSELILAIVVPPLLYSAARGTHRGHQPAPGGPAHRAAGRAVTGARRARTAQAVRRSRLSVSAGGW